MIEVRVRLGAFDMTIGDLLDLQQGKTYAWQVGSDAPLSLYVGEEKIAEAKLITEEEKVYVKITDIVDEPAVGDLEASEKVPTDEVGKKEILEESLY